MGGKGGCRALGISRACQSQETPKCIWTPGLDLKGGRSGGWGAGRREAIWSSRESRHLAAGRPAPALPLAGCVTWGTLFWLALGPLSSSALEFLAGLDCGFWSLGCRQGLSGRAYHLHHTGVLHCGHCHPLWVPSHSRPSPRGECLTPPPPPPGPSKNAPLVHPYIRELKGVSAGRFSSWPQGHASIKGLAALCDRSWSPGRQALGTRRITVGDEWDPPEVHGSRDVGIRKGSTTRVGIDLRFPQTGGQCRQRGDGGRAFVAREPVGSQPSRKQTCRS